MERIYFATGNSGKVEEAQKILPLGVEILDVDLEEIQSMNLEDIVTHKANQAYESVKEPVFVDDVSFEIEVWKGFPGPFIKYLQQIGNDQILYMMRNETNRNIKMIATIGYHDGKKVSCFTGEINGKLATESRGVRGWGFDPIVIPDGDTRTYSEMSIDEKNALSHRRLALDKFKKFLDSQKKEKAI